MAQENLSIDLKANAGDFIKAINDAVKALNELGGTAQDTGKAVKTTEEAMARATGPTKAFAVSVDQLSKSQLEINGRLISAQKAATNFGKGVAGAGKAVANANPTLVNFGRVIQDAPFGIIGIANNIDPLIASFQSLKTQTGSTGSALKALFSGLAGPAGIAIGVSAVTSALIAFGPQIKAFFQGVKAADEETTKFRENVGKETAATAGLLGVLRGANFSYDEKRKAIATLRQQFPGYLKDLTDEQLLANNAAIATQLTAQAILNRARARQQEEKIAQRTIRLLEIEANIGAQLGDFRKALRERELLRNTTDANTLASERFTANLNISEQRVSEIGATIKATAAEYKSLQQANEAAALSVAKLTAVDLKDVNAKKEKVSALRDENNELLINKTLREQLSVITTAETIRLLQLSKAAEAVAAAQQKRNIADQQRLLGGATTGVGAISRGIDPAVLAKQNEQAQRSANIIQQISDATNNANAAFGLLSPLIDQTFNALANGENVFEALGQGIKRLIVDLIKAVAQAVILSTVLNAIAPGAGGFGSIFGRLLGFGGRANGGFVGAGTPYVVGEAGPELFVPSTNGSIVPNMQMGGGGTLTARVAGNDLLFILNQAQGNKRRNFA